MSDVPSNWDFIPPILHAARCSHSVALSPPVVRLVNHFNFCLLDNRQLSLIVFPIIMVQL